MFMKYCISGRQPKSVLRKADEIRMQYRDKDRLIDYIEEFSDKTFILDIPKGVKDLDWDLYKTYSEKVDFILCLYDFELAEACKLNDLKFYWGYPIFSWYELKGVIAFEPCYLLLTAPLCFSLRQVKDKTDIPIRLCPNVANEEYIPREEGLHGPWVRPEDVKIYETWVTALEFKTDDLSKEETLLHIYKDNQAWSGNLNLLFTNFNINVDSRVLPDELGEVRANCNQRCMQADTCHYCESSILYATAVRNRYYEDLAKEKH